jgi:hypothetical protein
MNKKSIDTKNENMSDNFNAECYIPETSNNNSVNHTVNFIKKSPNEILTNENNSTNTYSNINNDNCSNTSLNITPPSIFEPTNLGHHEKINILNETSTVHGTTLTQALSNTQIQSQAQTPGMLQGQNSKNRPSKNKNDISVELAKPVSPNTPMGPQTEAAGQLRVDESGPGALTNKSSSFNIMPE